MLQTVILFLVSRSTAFHHFTLTDDGKHYVCRCSTRDGDEKSVVSCDPSCISAFPKFCGYVPHNHLSSRDVLLGNVNLLKKQIPL